MAVLDAIAKGDWTRLRPYLHPHVHWSDPDGKRIRGRKNVIAMLEASGSQNPPALHELRDGQIYRWQA